ncbi:hypothetical protein, partial [Klebsiella pneumoniae]|uniref:hypothetical protein n=1 Tax=Klebsiella pneumoniae TaxID=573 RepID=UPI0021C0E43E
MGSCAAPSAKGDDKFITTDYLQQCHNVRNVSVLLTPFQQVFWGWGFNHCGIVASAFGTQQPLRCKALRQLNLMGQI